VPTHSVWMIRVRVLSSALAGWCWAVSAVLCHAQQTAATENARVELGYSSLPQATEPTVGWVASVSFIAAESAKRHLGLGVVGTAGEDWSGPSANSQRLRSFYLLDGIRGTWNVSRLSLFGQISAGFRGMRPRPADVPRWAYEGDVGGDLNLGPSVAVRFQVGYGGVSASQSKCLIFGSGLVIRIATPPTPAVSAISPSPVHVHLGSQEIQVRGANFQPGLAVDVFDGAGNVTELRGDKVLEVTRRSFTMVVDVGTTPSTYGIEVVNPKGGRSARFYFPIR